MTIEVEAGEGGKYPPDSPIEQPPPRYDDPPPYSKEGAEAKPEEKGTEPGLEEKGK
jgi:hypothetical protein